MNKIIVICEYCRIGTIYIYFKVHNSAFSIEFSSRHTESFGSFYWDIVFNNLIASKKCSVKKKKNRLHHIADSTENQFVLVI